MTSATDPRQPPRVAPETRDRVQTLCLIALTAVALGVALVWLKAVLIPFVLALFLSIALAPLVDLQIRKLHMPRVVAVALVMVIAFALLVLIGLLVSSSVSQMAASATTYEEKLRTLVEKGLAKLPLDQWGIDVRERLDTFARDTMSNVADILGGALNTLLGLISQGFLVLVFVLFLLLGEGTATFEGGTWTEIKKRIQAYVLAKVWISALLGIAVGGVLAILHVDLALVFGVFTFLLNFIPNVGALVAILLPLPIALLSPDVSSTGAVLAVAIPALLQIVTGNVLEVRVLGRSLDLHPVAILLSLILWGALWGIVGMLLAAPITAAVKLALEKIPYTAQFAASFGLGPPKPNGQNNQRTPPTTLQS
jgi:AI-2 transport protein TqsA